MPTVLWTNLSPITKQHSTNSMYQDPRNVLIETYRKFEIYFNTEEETFHCISDYYDTEQKKKTYAATKTAIDTYIKENSTFRPFFVHNCKSKGWGSQYPTSSEDHKVKITGMRKDGVFVSEDGQISKYDEKNVFLTSPDNEVVFEEFKPLLEEKAKIEKMLDANRKKIEETSKKLNLVDLTEYRKTMNG